MRTAIIVPAAPHYANSQGKEQVWFGRIFAGIQLARDNDAPLVIVGDANGGSDVEVFAELARLSRVRVYTELNGTERAQKNTRGDMRAAARALCNHDCLNDVSDLILVTCWYHCPRAMIELRHALAEMIPHRRYSSRAIPVWSQKKHGLMRLLHPAGELRGIFDALLGRPHTMRGKYSVCGKPDMT